MSASTSSFSDLEELEARLAQERARLVRLCAFLAGRGDVAEDLAQETLLEAWRHRHKLRDAKGLRPWLAAIARNVCLRWRRGAAGRLTIAEDDARPASANIQLVPDTFDLEIELDREELALLLDRALAELPDQTRQALVARYIHESPIAEVAARLGLSEGAVAKRLERGKVIVRRVLETEWREEAADFGIKAAEPDAWRETRIWCPNCGASRLGGRFDAARPLLALRCPACHPAGVHTARTETLDLFAGLHGYKPALNRLMTWGHDYWTLALQTNAAICQHCGDTVG